MRGLYVGNDPALCLAKSEEQFFKSQSGTQVSSVVQQCRRRPRGGHGCHQQPENLSILGNAVAVDSESDRQ